MRLAIPYVNGFVAKNFGKAKEFEVYVIEDGKILASQVIPNKGLKPDIIGLFLKDLKIDAVICQKMGVRSKKSLEEVGIKIYPAITGVTDVRAEQFAQGTLHCDFDAMFEVDEEDNTQVDKSNCSPSDCASCSSNCSGL